MTTTPDAKTVREIARAAYRYLPHDYVRARLVQAALAEHGIDEHDVPTWSAYFNAAKADLVGATVSWPDEQPQEFECEVCTKPITAYPCILCEHEPDPWKKPDEQPQDERDMCTCGEPISVCQLRTEVDQLRGQIKNERKALTVERDEARELACVSLDILRNVSDQPMRELYGVDDFGEMPAWFTGYGKPSTGALDTHDANGGE